MLLRPGEAGLPHDVAPADDLGFDEALERVSRLLRQVTMRELSETYGLSLLQVQALASLWRSGPERWAAR